MIPIIKPIVRPYPHRPSSQSNNNRSPLHQSQASPSHAFHSSPSPAFQSSPSHEHRAATHKVPFCSRNDPPMTFKTEEPEYQSTYPVDDRPAHHHADCAPYQSRVSDSYRSAGYPIATMHEQKWSSYGGHRRIYENDARTRETLKAELVSPDMGSGGYSADACWGDKSQSSQIVVSSDPSGYHSKRPYNNQAHAHADVPFAPSASFPLEYIGLYEEVFDIADGIPEGMVRVWKDLESHYHYDCICGKRKAIRNLKAIQHHVTRHESLLNNVRTFPCPKCEKVFTHYLGLNSHQRTHKDS